MGDFLCLSHWFLTKAKWLSLIFLSYDKHLTQCCFKPKFKSRKFLYRIQNNFSVKLKLDCKFKVYINLILFNSYINIFGSCKCVLFSLADLGGGVRDARPPLGVQILSISCSFRENLACSRPPLEGSRPPLGKILDPPLVLNTKTEKDLFVTLSHIYINVVLS